MTTTRAQRVAARMDDGVARGMEMVLTPALTAAIGYVIDLVAGTVPVFTIAFAVLGLVGISVTTYYRYENEMRTHESRAAWRATPPAPLRPETPVAELWRGEHETDLDAVLADEEADAR